MSTPFKLRSGSSPLKDIASARNKRIVPDSVLVDAADLMGRGIDEPTSIPGMAALGLLEGLDRISTKAKLFKDSDGDDNGSNKSKGRKGKGKKKKKGVITVELPTVNQIDGQDVKGKGIIQRIFKRKKKK
tara:strand:- start:5 stop:394 length:390 start_codon:yes stop_codon:yes gene_type:complete